MSACCSKVDCGLEYAPPTILITFEGYDETDFENYKIKVLDKNGTVVQSQNRLVYNFKDDIYDSMLDNGSLKDFDYVIETDVSSDTIFNFSFDAVATESDCGNNCFLRKEKPRFFTRYQNYSYVYEGVQYGQAEVTLVK